MRDIRVWFQAQWGNGKFRILFVSALLVVIALGVEFVFLKYSILKSIRYLTLVLGLFFIAWIDGNSKRIPNKLLIILQV